MSSRKSFFRVSHLYTFSSLSASADVSSLTESLNYSLYILFYNFYDIPSLI